MGLAAIAGTATAGEIAEDRGVARRAAPVEATARAAFEVDDVFRIVYVVDARISPDGRQVVIVREAVDTLDDRWHGNLWVVGTDGGVPRPLTEGHHYDSSPRISPDGSRVAFFSDRSGTPQIYVKPIAAGPEQPAVQVSGLAVHQEPWGLGWSPDGSMLSFVARERTPGRDLGPLTPPPPGADWAEPPRIIDRLVYRSDGRGYLNPGCERVFLLPAAGGEARRATRASACVDEATIDPLNHERDDSAPVWTPDGKHLIVAANHRDDRQKILHPVDLDLYEIEVATGEMRPLLRRPGLDSLPEVSPDGRRIAFVGFEDRFQAFQAARLYVMDRQGGGLRVLTGSLDRDVEGPRWTADGESVVFSFHDHGTTRIARVGLGGGEVRWLAEGVSDGYSAYDGGGFTLSRSGRIAFTHSTQSLAGEAAIVDLPASASGLEPSAVRRITTFNEAWLSRRTLAVVEEMHFDAADGRRIQGWLMKPPHPSAPASPGGPPPVVLDIHGGPFLNWGTRFDLEKQILASRGFAVLFVNPRGSTGYGEDFANLVHRKYPGDDVHDLLRAIDHLVGTGEADANRLFVTGGSGGALLTLTLLTETDRFRSAVAIYPLSNWSSLVLTSDLAPLMLDRWLPGPPWQHREFYLEHSPVWNADRIVTPTLLIAGEEDYRTPMSEAEQMFAALQIRGVESVLVRLPEEPHFAERRPSHYRARIGYALHWFESHLGFDPDPAPSP